MARCIIYYLRWIRVDPCVACSILVYAYFHQQCKYSLFYWQRGSVQIAILCIIYIRTLVEYAVYHVSYIRDTINCSPQVLVITQLIITQLVPSLSPCCRYPSTHGFALGKLQTFPGTLKRETMDFRLKGSFVQISIFSMQFSVEINLV